MAPVIRWLEATFLGLPSPLLEVWGRVSYLLGFALALFAFAGFTFRRGGEWRIGRQRQRWDATALLSIPLTFVLVTLTGWDVKKLRKQAPAAVERLEQLAAERSGD